MKRTIQLLFYSVVLLIASQGICMADAGLPMIFMTMPTMVVALIPVILIESVVIQKYLKIRFGYILKITILQNVVSTIFGIPIVWFILVVIQIITGGGSAYGLDTLGKQFLAVTWQAPWLIPYEEDFGWMIPAATLTLLVPFFFASWKIEYYVAQLVYKEIGSKTLNHATRNANFISYCALAGYVILKM